MWRGRDGDLVDAVCSTQGSVSRTGCSRHSSGAVAFVLGPVFAAVFSADMHSKP